MPHFLWGWYSVIPVYAWVRGACAFLLSQGAKDEEDEDRFQATLEPSKDVYAPKCLCLLSTWPYFEQFREWFLNLYRISLSPSQVNRCFLF